MPAPNTSYGDLLSTTINKYSAKVSDNFSKNRPLLDHMRKNNNIISSGGVQIQEAIMYQSAGNIKRYSGFEVIDVGLNNSISSAVFDWKQYAGPVAVSGLEMIQNSSEEQKLELIGARVEATGSGLMNLVSDDLFSSGTADGGKQLGGLQLLVADSPATGTVGGIDRASNVFWRNVSFDATTNGGAATTAANITTYMSRVYQKVTRNGDEPDVIIMDDYYYALFEQSVIDKQRFENGNKEDTTQFGFSAYRFKNARVYNGGGFQGADSNPWDATVSGGCPYQHIYFLNSKYLKLRTVKGRDFKTIGDGKRVAINQDAEVQLMGWTGALTMNCAALQGVLVE